MGITEVLSTLPERAHAHYAATGQPLVVLSYAQSLDAALTAAPGRPTALSGPQALRWTHQLRAACDGILVGIGTLLADDPQLTVRHVEGPNPQPIVLDTHSRTPPDARLMHHPTHTLWLVTLGEGRPPAECLHGTPTPQGRIDLSAMLDLLGKRGIYSLMVEGGPTVLKAFMTAQLAQAALITIVPRWLGQGSLQLVPDAGATLHNTIIKQAGDDMMMWGVFGA